MKRRVAAAVIVALLVTVVSVGTAGAGGGDPRDGTVHRVTTFASVVIHDHDSLSADEHCEWDGTTSDTVRPIDGVEQLGDGVPELDYQFSSGPFRDSAGTPIRFACDEYALCFSTYGNANGLSPQGDANVEAFASGLVRVTLPYTFEDINGSFPHGDPPPCIGDEVLGSGVLVISAWPGQRVCTGAPPSWQDGDNRIAMEEVCVSNDYTRTPPVAAGAIVASSGVAPLTVQLDASASHDPDGYLVEYRWEFGDGRSRVTTSPVTHYTYAVPGSYVPKVTVVDHTGLTDRVELAGGPVRVDEVPPEPTPEPTIEPVAGIHAAVTGPAATTLGEPIVLDASASVSTPFAIAEYRWEFGDGKTEVTVDPKVEHAYLTLGTHTVSVTVVNRVGHMATATHKVTVKVGDLEPPDTPIFPKFG
ncbi:MAG: PKD domain-containing protein [Acidimicrobiales bacterium]|nr:PKD domain-containing protein [Acidimicrobiales bacterium]